MSEQIVDQQIVERVQRGDKNAYGLLVVKYQQKVGYLVSRYVKNSGDVADVTQEAFIKAYRALPNFRGDSAFYTWLYRIAVNSAKNYLVSQGRKPPASDVDAEKNLMSQQMEKLLFDAMDKLPEDLRMAISLRELEGLSYEDIASVMDCPVGTVRSRIFRAREALDKVIQPLLMND
jgi:RNA polymerase sigma-70 factor (ECF subfamily)